MRFKTDENLHPEAAELLRSRGHDACTVWDQAMRGAGDPRVIEACRLEGCALLTLDLDFADIRRYPPDRFSGIVVLRLPRHSRRMVLSTIEAMLAMTGSEPLIGRLWIVEPGQVRIHGDESRA